MPGFAITLADFLHIRDWVLKGSVIEDEGARLRVLEDEGHVFQIDSYQFDFETLALLGGIPLPTKFFGGYCFLEAEHLDLDLTDLSDFPGAISGDTSFAKVVALLVSNLEDPGTGRVLKVGKEGSSAEWYDPFGTSGSTILVYPWGQLPILNFEGGLNVGTGGRKLLRIDSQTHSIKTAVVIAGI